MINFSETITLEDYVLTNLDLKRDRTVIRLTDEKEYPVLVTLEKNGKTKRKVYFIKKDDKYYRLDEDVKKSYLSKIRKYRRCGIWNH